MSNVRLNPEDKDGKVVYNAGIVRGIVALAISDVEGAQPLPGKKSGISLYIEKDGIYADVSVIVKYGYNVPELAYRIQQSIRQNVENMTKYKVAKVDVHVEDVLFEDAPVAPVSEEQNKETEDNQAENEKELTAKIPSTRRVFSRSGEFMRNTAREAALNIIFAGHFNEVTNDFKKKIYDKFKLERDEDLLFAADLVATVEEHRAELLSEIESASHHYLENRINPTDKSILLIAMAEIRYFDDIPPVVSVSEAAGLARKYSTETSADFVNGVLSGIINK